MADIILLLFKQPLINPVKGINSWNLPECLVHWCYHTGWTEFSICTSFFFQLKRYMYFKHCTQDRVLSCVFRVVYDSWQPAKFASFSARFRRLLSLLHQSRYVEEMMFVRSHNHLHFTKLQLLKNLKKTLYEQPTLTR